MRPYEPNDPHQPNANLSDRSPLNAPLPRPSAAPLADKFDGTPFDRSTAEGFLTQLTERHRNATDPADLRDLYAAMQHDFSAWWNRRSLVSEAFSPFHLRLGGSVRNEMIGSTLPLHCAPTAAPIPAHYLALTESRLRDLTQHPPGTLSWREVYCTLMESTRGTLTPFGLDTLNLFNSLYFNAADAFSSEFGLANKFVREPEVNRALGTFLSEVAAALDRPMRVKEICCGKDPSRWPHVMETCRAPFELTLSDFTEAALPDTAPLTRAGLNVATCVDNLLEGFTPLPNDQRFDVVFTTYGYDSIFLPGDAHYERLAGQWYEYRYRLTAPEDHPASRLVAPGPDDLASLNLSAAEVARLRVEVAPFPVAADQVPSRHLLETFLEGSEDGRFSYPGGIVKSIVEAFETQLSANGVFLVGDVGSYSPEAVNAAGAYVFDTSGIGAKFKLLDFFIMNLLLAEQGFRGYVLPVPKFIAAYGGHNVPPAKTEPVGGSPAAQPWPQHYFLLVMRSRQR